MWEQYKKTFIYTQLFILAICIVLRLYHVAWEGLAGPLVVMEIGAIYGARWAVRLRPRPDGKISMKPMPPLYK